ncbi:transposase [Patescibacteria group bacterium]|nr:transposase [Patescibacteria group bacterium]
MIALLNQIPSETKIKKLLRKIVFGRNMCCPFCNSRKVGCSESRYRCQRCRRPFSLFSGTWLSNLKLSLRTFWALLWCWVNQVPVKQTVKLCHVSEVSVYHWFRQFRLHLPDFETILAGKVQMDEAYFRNISLLMAKEIGSKKLAHQIVYKNSVNKSEASQFLFQYIQPKSKLQTDGSSIYKKINQWWQVKHKVDIHRKFQFGLTSEIEGIFGNLRTFIRRMYHHTTPEHLPEYVSEFCLRFSSPEIFTSPNDYLAKTLKPVPTC